MDDKLTNPLEIFEQLELQSLGNQLSNSEDVAGEFWRGFVFNVGGLDLVAPFTGEYEIVPNQKLYPLPMSRSWVKGVTNIRGEIYTVIDFSEFIGQKPTRITKTCNLFLLPDPTLKSALLLASRISLRSFSTELPVTSATMFGSRLSPYISRVLIDGSTRWGVLDIDALSKSESFSQIGQS
jgi:twitching motility protein PilI